MRRWIVTTHYTRHSPYELAYRKLAQSCEDLGIRLRGYPFDSCGSWLDNICYRVNVSIPQALRDYPGTAIFNVDADSEFVRYPHELDKLDCDFAGVWRRDTELQGGTLWFANNERATELLHQWQERCKAIPEGMLDQTVLQHAIEAGIDGLTVQRLPQSYSVFPDDQTPDPVLRQSILSRTLRYKIDRRYNSQKERAARKAAKQGRTLNGASGV